MEMLSFGQKVMGLATFFTLLWVVLPPVSVGIVFLAISSLTMRVFGKKTVTEKYVPRVFALSTVLQLLIGFGLLAILMHGDSDQTGGIILIVSMAFSMLVIPIYLIWEVVSFFALKTGIVRSREFDLKKMVVRGEKLLFFLVGLSLFFPIAYRLVGWVAADVFGIGV